MDAAQPLRLPDDARAAACMTRWLARAAEPESHDTRLFAKLIAERESRGELALLGLSEAEWRGLMRRHFRCAEVDAEAPSPVAHEHADFVASLHALLVRHANRSADPDDARCLATLLTRACLRPDHLWRDLGLAGREEVTWMLTRYFPALVVLNVANLRWKKFLAQQRALAVGVEPGPAPGCPGCEDYGFCFPERV